MNPYLIKGATVGVGIGGPVSVVATEAAEKIPATFMQKLKMALGTSAKRGLFGALVGGSLVGGGALVNALSDRIRRSGAVDRAQKNFPGLAGMSRKDIERVSNTIANYSPIAARDPAMLAYMVPRLNAMGGGIDPAMAATLAKIDGERGKNPLKAELAKGIAGGALKGMFLPDVSAS